MNILSCENLPHVPLLLWKTPPGLELILAQEGVPFLTVRGAHPAAFNRGRFILFDGKRTSRHRLHALLGPDHVTIDIDVLRGARHDDPFATSLDTEGKRRRFLVDGVPVLERIARVDHGAIRERLLASLRSIVEQTGGIWARLARYPYPYRSVFNFRADLDEPFPRDLERFLRNSREIADCTTLFVSTRAYGRNAAVMQALADYDTQSHGHNHVVYRDEQMNWHNLRRAHETLGDHGLMPTAFAAPEGRWNAGLDRSMESLGYRYSSDFQLSHDDYPFFPWRDGRFSNVLQIPIHPICEGLFLDAGVEDLRGFAEYLRRIARAKIEAGEPAFLYGHPERRLGRHQSVLDPLIREVVREPLLWRVTLTEFARWWRWRLGRKWSLSVKAAGRVEVQFEDWDSSYAPSLEIVRGENVASLPLTGPRTVVSTDQLAFTKRKVPSERLVALDSAPKRGFKDVVKEMLDWETVTPIEELPSRHLRDQIKRRLRRSKGHAQTDRFGVAS